MLRRLRAAGRTQRVRAARGRHRASTSSSSSPAWRCSSTTPSGSPATRTSRSRRTTPRTCSRRWRRSCCAAGSARRCGSRSRSRHRPAGARPAGHASSASPTSEVFRLPGPLDLRGLHDIADLDRAELQVPRVRARPPTRTWPRSSRPRRSTCSRRCSSRDVLLHHPYDSFATSRAALHRAGRRRPARAGDQADALPHLRRLPDHRRPDRRGRGRQAGAGARRDQGPLRRAGQHPLGPQARAGRLPRGLRPGRPEDPLQAVAWSCATSPTGLRRYTHIGTGNYNPKTARIYEDLGLLTADDADRRGRRPPVQPPVRLSRRKPTYKRLLVAPDSRAHGPDRADRRTRSRTTRPAGRPASGSRSTRSSTRRSSTRSTAPRRPACRWSCWVRGICALRPGVPGLSREHPGALASSAASSSTAGSSCSTNGGEPEVVDRLAPT